ncbi:hypothetical protein MLD38_034658 [Melastoma candidum]|uniref:Uncharacterized protein n=1 Tax=Melastoma candidum TaxID=119954 RepID=A0ACB9MCW8_9MYRT|nr:hypothetical protein MLD38_034658 [Melastoma candidum]
MAFSNLFATCNIPVAFRGSTRFFRLSSSRRRLLYPDCRFNRPPQTTYRWFARLTTGGSSATGPEDALVFEHYVAGKVSRINKALELAVPLRHPLRIHESMRYTLLGHGKRVPGIMCLVSCELVGGDESWAMPAACAMEMVHAMSLIYDDLPCLDDDDLRRGKPTNHRAFDEGTALLAGEALLALVFELMAGMEEVPASRVVRAMLELGQAAGSEGMAAGEIMDKLSEGREDISLEELEYIHKHKSSIGRAATVCGAIIGGANEDEIERLREFGTKVGLLYQVIDDVLDVTRTSKELGKDAGSDLAKDKATFPKFMGIEGAKKYAFRLLDEILLKLSYFNDERAAPPRRLASFFVNRQK